MDRWDRWKREFVRRYAAWRIRRHGFWFVDIPRTSSSSIRVELGRRFGGTYGKSNLLETNHEQSQFLPSHQPARTMRDLIGRDAWTRMFTFSFVRNPWDRVASLYAYRIRKCTLPEGTGFRAYVRGFLAPEDVRAHATHNYHGFYYGALDYLVDETDQVIVDFVGRYENRHEDIAHVADRIGCPGLGTLHIQRAQPPDAHYSHLYDDELVEIVGRIFARDAEVFGYEFEDLR